MTSSRSGHPGCWIAAIVVGLVTVQILTGWIQATYEVAGTARNDLELNVDSLPDILGTWSKTSFERVSSGDGRNQNDRVWTHSWRFQKDRLSAYVAFDQAGFMHWHDLTVCYQGLGWSMDQKRVLSDADATEEWPVVSARLSKQDGSTALLLFSLFFDDGDPVDARAYELAGTVEDGFRRMLGARFDRNRRTSRIARLRQCQVFVQYTGELAPSTESSIVDLHLRTRKTFRDQWLTYWHALNVAGERGNP